MALLDRFRKQEKPPVRQELGRSGTVSFQGFLTSEELNRNLVWPLNLQNFDEMRRTDPTIRWMLALVKTPIRAATWEVEPASDDDEDREIAAFCEYALREELEGGLDNLIRQSLLYLDYGHYVFERIADLREVQFSYEAKLEEVVTPEPVIPHPDPTQDPNADPAKPAPKPPGTPTPPPVPPPIPPKPKLVTRTEDRDVKREAFVLSRLAPRLPRTIHRWITAEDNAADLQAIEQWLPNGETPRVVPADRLVVLCHEREGDDFRGQSLLRAAYKSYRYKVQLENLEAIALERSAGFLVAFPPADANTDDLDAMEAALKSARQGENLYLITPGPEANTQREGWTIKDLAISGDGSRSSTGASAASGAISRHEMAMAKNVLAEFMKLGHEKVGARATSENQQDPYYQAVESQVRYLEDALTEQVIAPLVAWNYDTDKVPRLRASKIQAQNIQFIAEAWAKLVQAKAVVPSVEDENWLRSMMDAPKRKLAPGEEDGLGSGPAPITAPGGGDGQPPAPDKPKPDKPPDPKSGGGGTFAEFRPRRALRPEEKFVALAEISTALDTAQEQLQSVIEDAAQPLVSAAIGEARGVHDAGQVNAIEVNPEPLVAPILNVLTQTYQRGREEVASELAKQGAPARFEVARIPSQAERAQRLKAQAVALAESVGAAVTRTARSLATRLLENPRIGPIGPGYDPGAAVRGAARGGALSTVSSIFNDGRRDEQLARADEIEIAVYTAILDERTCLECESADGTESEPGGDPELLTPNPMCEGGGACRCMYIPVLKSEGEATAFPEGIPDVELPVAA